MPATIKKKEQEVLSKIYDDHYDLTVDEYGNIWLTKDDGEEIRVKPKVFAMLVLKELIAPTRYFVSDKYVSWREGQR